MFDTSIKDPNERTKRSWESVSSVECYFDSQIYPHITHFHTTLHPSIPNHTTTIFLLNVNITLCNRMNNLHGGAVATIFDMLTSVAFAPIAKPITTPADENLPFWNIPGVSRTLNCTYLRPVLEGMRVAVFCEVMGAGRRLATARGWMREVVVQDGEEGEGSEVVARDEKGRELRCKGEILATCEHGKVNVDSSRKSKI